MRDLSGQPVGPGEMGEIWVRGEQVSGEYEGIWPQSTNDEGWFPTKDGGFLDAEGFLFVDGRLDDVIVRGGENISPGEVEDVLLAHPAVADVGVVGYPDEHWGEAVGAAVIIHAGAAATADELCEWVRGPAAVVQGPGPGRVRRGAPLQRQRQAGPPPPPGDVRRRALGAALERR